MVDSGEATFLHERDVRCYLVSGEWDYCFLDNMGSIQAIGHQAFGGPEEPVSREEECVEKLFYILAGSHQRTKVYADGLAGRGDTVNQGLGWARCHVPDFLREPPTRGGFLGCCMLAPHGPLLNVLIDVLDGPSGVALRMGDEDAA